MSFPFELQHICVKSRNGRVWYAADSASFYAEEEGTFRAEVQRLSELYSELEFAVVLYDAKRGIAPAKYRPWAD